MCARYEFDTDSTGAFTDAFGVPMPSGVSGTAYPGSAMPIIVDQGGTRACITADWGLIPAWAKDPTIARSCFNARAETVATKPAFRDSFRSSRCIVPASRFIEWHGEPKARTPYVCALRDHPYLAFAGLASVWTDPDGKPRTTYTVITTTANADMAPVHDRMPVILAPEGIAAWLDSAAPQASLFSLLVPAPDGSLTVQTAEG